MRFCLVFLGKLMVFCFLLVKIVSMKVIDIVRSGQSMHANCSSMIYQFVRFFCYENRTIFNEEKSKTSGFRLLFAELVYAEKLFLLYMREVRDSIIPFVRSHKTGRGKFFCDVRIHLHNK